VEQQSAKEMRGNVIDASHRFGSRFMGAPAPLERIVFDPARGACRSVEMSVDELQTLIELLKGQFEELLAHRRVAANAKRP
jgi:hypothetical protein